MRDKIKAILNKYDSDICYSADTQQFGINESDYDDIADDIVKLFPIHNVSKCDCGKENKNIPKDGFTYMCKCGKEI